MITSVVAVDVEVSVGRSPSNHAMHTNEYGCTLGSLVEVKAEERARAMRRFPDLRESCRAKRRGAPVRVSEAVGLAVKLVDCVVAASSSSASDVVVPHIDELTRKLAITRVEVISSTVKLSGLEVARNKAGT